MADLVEIPIDESNPTFVEDVNLIQVGEKVKGGDITAPANKQAYALALRTAWLKAQLTAIGVGIKMVGTVESEAALDAIDTTGMAVGTGYFVSTMIALWNGTEWVLSNDLIGPRGITMYGVWPDANELPDPASTDVGSGYVWKKDIWILVPGDGDARVWASLGLEGPEGASAYAVAVAGGYSGTQAQWLASLVGKSAYQSWKDQGNTGTEAQFVTSLQGQSTYQLWVALGNTGTEADFITAMKIKGDKGDTGDTGETGPARAAFAVVGYLTDAANLPSPGKEDEAYYVGIDLHVWHVLDAEANTGEWLTIPGVAGENAYQLWLAQGNTGTIDDFFLAYKGSKGDTGDDGDIGPAGKNLDVRGTVADEATVKQQTKEDQAAYVAADTGHLWIYRLASDTWVDLGAFRGIDGKSSYQSWLDTGNTGTEADFVTSLKGRDGTNIVLKDVVATFSALPAGVDATDIYAVQDENSIYAWINGAYKKLGAFKGDNGSNGTNGTNGTNGANGKSINIIKILTEDDQTIPDAFSNAGSAYVDLDSVIWIAINSTWVSAGTITVGDKGETGTGLKILGNVSTVGNLPDKADHVEGDAYFALDTKMLYILQSGEWSGPFDITGLKGDKGADGEKGDAGTSINVLGAYDTADALNTAHPTGTLGDGYLVGTHLYVWTTADSGSWIDVGEVRGPTGATGPEGPIGPDGKQGLKGDKGSSWLTLPAGVDAPAAGFTGNTGDWAVSESFKVYYKSATSGWQYWGQLVAGDVNSPLLSLGKVVRLGTEWVMLPVDEVATPEDGKFYVRQLVADSNPAVTEWVELTFPVQIEEPTADGKSYMRVRANGADVGSWALYTAPTLAGLGGVALTELGISVAQLVNGTVPASQLPSYVDDVVDVDNQAALPTTGEKGKIYITDDTNVQYRWTGTQYVQIVASPGTSDAVAEGSTNLYYTPARVRATTLAGVTFSTAGAITTTDTVLTAFGKLQAQITAIVPGFADVPTDTNLYLRKGDKTWSLYTAPAAGISDAPNDTNTYARNGAAWVAVSTGITDAPAGTYAYERVGHTWSRLNRYTLALVAATTELDLSTAQVFSIANSSARTLTFKSGTVPAADRAMTVILIINGTGVITWPSTIVWNGGAQPTLGATTTVVSLLWDGIGSRWIGNTGATF